MSEAPFEFHEQRLARERAEREARERVDENTLLVGGERVRIAGCEYRGVGGDLVRYRVQEWREALYGIARDENGNMIALGDTLVVNT